MARKRLSVPVQANARLHTIVTAHQIVTVGTSGTVVPLRHEPIDERRRILAQLLAS